MIFLFSDYGLQGPYLGQVQTVLHQLSPQTKVINLQADAPRNNPKASAYLLASLVSALPEEAIFSVVDPGVGNERDDPVVMRMDKRWYVGPDNGLFDLVARRACSIESWRITWQPDTLSNSFHGRDLYAPVCAMLANAEPVPGKLKQWRDKHDWPDDLNEIIYIVYFGNAMIGCSIER